MELQRHALPARMPPGTL